jgi:uncharacterized repeat protein (TIGR03803 family)
LLHLFSGADGAAPLYSLVFDSSGNLFGNTTQGGNLRRCLSSGSSGCGVVFELSPTSGGSWHETVLHAFTGDADGSAPSGAPALDNFGNLYGTTSAGANQRCFNGCGVVFSLTPASGGGWTETVLHSFSGNPDGGVPAGGVILGTTGNLYGTTAEGGPNGNGTVFRVIP